MKQVIFMSVTGALALLSLAAVLTLWSRRVRENNLNKAVSTAMEQTLDSLEKGVSYRPANSEQMEAEFLQHLFRHVNAGDKNNIDKDMKLDVNVSECDPDKGIISVRVDETFTYPGGKKGNITVNRTAIREKEKEKKLINVNFSGYIKLVLEEGEKIDAPKDAKIYGKNVSYWTYKNVKRVEFPVKIIEDMELYPVY